MARREEILTQRRRDAEEAWPVVRLGDVCEEMRERIPSSNVSLECYITTDNMVKGCGGVRIADNVPEAVGLVRYQKGDVLLSNIRPYLKKSWLADRDGGCSSDVIVFRSLHSDLSPEYLFRVLSQDGFFDYSMQNVSGTKMPRGKRDWIKAFQFPLPPLPIQREIVARLEKELGEADKLAAKFKRVAELADDAFKAELDETFMAVEGEKVRLGDVCVIQRGGSPRPIKKYLTTSTNGLNWIKIGDVASDGKYIVSVEDKITPSGLNKTRRVKAGDFLLSNSMSFGRPYILKIDGCIHDGWLVLHGFQDKFSEDYFYYLLRSSSVQIQFDSLAHGSSVRNLNTSAVSSVEVSITSLPEQRTIVAKLDAAKERCEKLKAAAMRGLAAAENLRKAILAEAFEQ